MTEPTVVQEWGVRVIDDTGDVLTIRCRSELNASEELDRLPAGHIVSRTVTTTPWEAVREPEPWISAEEMRKTHLVGVVDGRLDFTCTRCGKRLFGDPGPCPGASIEAPNDSEDKS